MGKKVNGALAQGWLYQDQLKIAAEFDGSSALVSRFVYGTKVNVPEYMQKGGKTYRLVTDHLGSVRMVVDASSGDLAQRIDYDEFGKVLSDTNPGFQPFGFAGGPYDSQTRLVRFGARDYDAQTGRWTAKDPIAFKGGDANLYSYARQEPINFADRSGLQVEGAPVPPNIPGGPWKWSPDPGNNRGGNYKGPDGASASWDPDGHWDVDDGKGHRQRYDKWGNEITAEQAHNRKKPKGKPIKNWIKVACRVAPPIGFGIEFGLELIDDEPFDPGDIICGLLGGCSGAL